MANSFNLNHLCSASGRKSAMKFDLDKMFEETKRTAKAYSQEVKGNSS